MTTIAPPEGAAPSIGARHGAPELLRRYRRPLGVAAVLLFLAGLLAFDHGGTPPVVNQAVGRDVITTGPVALDATGDPRVQAQPQTLHLEIDGAGLLAVTVTLTSNADQPLIVDGRARLLSAGAKLVAGFAGGGTVVPAHGSALLRLAGTPPILAVGTVILDLHATVQPKVP